MAADAAWPFAGDIDDIWTGEVRTLMPASRSFNGFVDYTKRVRPASSMWTATAQRADILRQNRPVSVRVYPDRIVVAAEGLVVWEHCRIIDRSHDRPGQTIYNGRHYLAVVQRKPGTHRNGTPFAELPDAFRNLQQHLLQGAGRRSRDGRHPAACPATRRAGVVPGRGNGVRGRRSNQNPCAEPAPSTRRRQIDHTPDHHWFSGCDAYQRAESQCRARRRFEEGRGGCSCVIILPTAQLSSCCKLKDARHGADCREVTEQGAPAFEAAIPVLSQLLMAEIAERHVRSTAYQLKPARLPAYRDLNGFDFTSSEVIEALVRQLHRGEFIDDANNVVLVGEPGRGKTHIATALGVWP